MKIFALSSVLTLSAVASAAFVPQAARLRRDVNELAAAAEYLPPVTEYLPIAVTEPEPELERQLLEAEPELEPESAVLGDDGYEYRAVRRLKLRHRNRRDVSHLPKQYLPPSHAYLPPAQLPDDTEEVLAAVQPKLALEYLPPVEQQQLVETEAPATEAPEAPETEAPATEQPEVRFVDVPAAELQDDGYHYQQPAELPALREAAPEYLPPLDAEAVVVEGPADGESAVLAKDGYHYRAIRRYRF